MGINFYLATVEPKKVSWVPELDHYSFQMSNSNASWLLRLIGVNLHDIGYCGTLSLDQAEELLVKLAENFDMGTRDCFIERGNNMPTMIYGGRTSHQIKGYYKELARLISAARDNGLEVIAYA